MKSFDNLNNWREEFLIQVCLCFSLHRCLYFIYHYKLCCRHFIIYEIRDRFDRLVLPIQRIFLLLLQETRQILMVGTVEWYVFYPLRLLSLKSFYASDALTCKIPRHIPLNNEHKYVLVRRFQKRRLVLGVHQKEISLILRHLPKKVLMLKKHSNAQRRMP